MALLPLLLPLLSTDGWPCCPCCPVATDAVAMFCCHVATGPVATVVAIQPSIAAIADSSAI